MVKIGKILWISWLELWGHITYDVFTHHKSIHGPPYKNIATRVEEKYGDSTKSDIDEKIISKLCA